MSNSGSRNRRPAFSLEEIKQMREVSPLVEWFNLKIAESGMYQTDIADAVGVRTTVFSAWKTGRQKLTVEAIVKICQVLKCDKNYPIGLKFDELFGTEWRSLENSKTESLSETEQELVDIYREVGEGKRLTPEAVAIFKTLLKTLPKS